MATDFATTKPQPPAYSAYTLNGTGERPYTGISWLKIALDTVTSFLYHPQNKIIDPIDKIKFFQRIRKH
jgi:hypothetical protein